MVENLEVTGTYKLKKTDLQKQGFDIGQVKDPLFVRDEAKRAYAPLTKAVFGDIQAQKIRI